MSTDDITLTGVKDVDRNILMNVPTESLKDACVVNTYTESLCDRHFWHQRFTQDFVELGKPERTFDYRKVYWEVVEEMNKSPYEVFRYAMKNDLLELFKWAVDAEDDDGEMVSNDLEMSETLDLVIADDALTILRYLVEEKNYPLADEGWQVNVASPNLAVTRYLLEDHQIDITSGYQTERVLTAAIQYGNLDVFEYLWKHLRDLKGITVSPDLYINKTIAHDNIGILDYLIRNVGPSPERINKFFLYAAENASVRSLDHLLKAGALINGPTNDSKPLMATIRYGFSIYGDKYKAIEFLIDHGARIDIDVLGEAAEFMNNERLEVLLKKRGTISELEANRIIIKSPYRRGSEDSIQRHKLLRSYIKSDAIEPSSKSPRGNKGAETRPLSPRGNKGAETRPISPRGNKGNRSPQTSPRKQETIASSSESKQCIAKTKSGDRCKKWAVRGSNYCSVHQKR